MENDDALQRRRSIEVMFDGACPLCRMEIDAYRQLRATTAIEWIDVSACDFQAPAGTTKHQLLQRFHLITPDGRILSGAEAFVFIWNSLPGWRWLGQLSSLPGMLYLMERLYRGFLLFRPALQKFVKFFMRKH